ncbi:MULTISPECIES: type II toxin-antitoxin system HicA family toxin [unclassified Psychrobacter]|uniref:type II toxin-antitoxin system HicA family toxin n=1 Tax=unclassified Psychrobacter TaxID=196806 RepID=UPI00191975B2|nr:MULTISPECIES: type II toxin-antitoxin system HicA family toxin [unclassified Psychrobacter]
MKSSTLIKLLEEDGWKVIRKKGTSHHILKKEGIDKIISISHPEKDVSRLQLTKARRISGLKL